MFRRRRSRPTDARPADDRPSGDGATDASAADRWAEALERWAIPEPILAQAPEDPWAMPVARFVADPDERVDTPSIRAAAALLGQGGTVLDVGCGGGRSSIPLLAMETYFGNPLVEELTGFDARAEMLRTFAEAGAAVGASIATVEGIWPDDAELAPPADVVVSHHMAYNVARIEDYVVTLSAKARRGCVVELPRVHPLSRLSPLWKRFWDLDRPSEPTAELFVDVVRSTGADPFAMFEDRPDRHGPDASGRVDDLDVAVARRHLCLPPGRDDEVREALVELGSAPRSVATVWWRTDTVSAA